MQQAAGAENAFAGIAHAHTDSSPLLFLPGQNTATGGWSGTVDVGPPPPALFEMVGQILSAAPRSGQAVLSDASRLIAPPAGQGLVGARLVSANDRTAKSGTISFASFSPVAIRPWPATPRSPSR